MMQIWIAQQTEQALSPHQDRDTAGTGTETARGLGAGSHKPWCLHLTSLWVILQGICCKQNWFPHPKHNVGTLSGPSLLLLPTPPGCSQIRSLAASKPVPAAHSGFEQLQTLCPTGSLPLQPGLSQLWLPGFSCSAVTGQHPPPSS